MDQIIDFKLKLGDINIFAAVLIFVFNQFVFKLDSHFSLVVKIILILILSIFKLFPFILQHIFQLSEVMIIYVAII